MTYTDELRLIAKVARLYYENGLRQPEIADQLELSQATVSRLLKRARDENIVRITIQQPSGAYPELEEKIQRSYGLKDVIVADCLNDSDPEILRGIGSAAAFYVDTTLNQKEIVGISSWSETLLAMVNAMQTLARSTGAQVVQILGGIGNPATGQHATNLTRRLAEKLNGEAIFLPAPGIVASQEMRNIFYQDQYVKQAVQLFDKVTLALVGIGSVEPSRMLASSGNIFSAEELGSLRQQGAVGDICLHFYNAQGQPLLSQLNDRVIGMQLSQLQKVKRAVGIAGGERKLEAIRGALVGKWINILITDRFTAEQLSHS
jgi:DNA-binding transcriptional regulator LsrR (DeoR family)